MSRGLGPVQLRALALIGRAPAGVDRPALAGLLNVTPRRGRRLVASLAARGLVVLVGGRVWSRAGWADWSWQESESAHYAALHAGRYVVVCPGCGLTVEVRGPLRANESGTAR